MSHEHREGFLVSLKSMCFLTPQCNSDSLAAGSGESAALLWRLKENKVCLETEAGLILAQILLPRHHPPSSFSWQQLITRN